MSLKEEVEKIIRAEREKLEAQDRNNANYHNVCKEQFKPLRAILEEISASFNSEYLKVDFYPYSARIEVGRKDGEHFSEDITWKIEPNYEIKHDEEKGTFKFLNCSGFRIEEIQWFRHTGDSSEDEYVSPTEHHVADMLVKKIGERVAFYLHLEDKHKKS